MTRPTVGILVGPPANEQLVKLLNAITRWADVRQVSITEDGVDAWIATGTSVHSIEELIERHPNRVAVWTDSEQEASRMSLQGVRLITGDRDLSSKFDAVLADGLVDISQWAYIPSFLRSRLRRRYGLPDVLVVNDGLAEEPAPTPAPLLHAGLQVASVATVGENLIEALALGAPCVTDIENADRYGLTASDAVIVVEPHEVVEAADMLSRQELRCAVLSRRGRALVEEGFDLARVAGRLASKLGLARPSSPLERMAREITDLGPAGAARVVQRVAGAVHPLPAGNNS